MLWKRKEKENRNEIENGTQFHVLYTLWKMIIAIRSERARIVKNKKNKKAN